MSNEGMTQYGFDGMEVGEVLVLGGEHGAMFSLLLARHREWGTPIFNYEKMVFRAEIIEDKQAYRLVGRHKGPAVPPPKREIGGIAAIAEGDSVEVKASSVPDITLDELHPDDQGLF